MRLGESLVGQGLVTAEQVAAALERQRQQGGRLGAHLVAMGALTIDELLAALNTQANGAAVLGLCERTLHRCETAFGPDHPDTNRARYEYARTLLTAGRVDDCVKQAEAAFLAHRTALGAHHAWTDDAAHLLIRARQVQASLALIPAEIGAG
jgi:hypothetical protein